MIKFLDLKSINSFYQKEFIDDVNKIFQKGIYLNGDFVNNFERDYSSYCNTRFCVAVSNGMDALTLILKSLIICKKIEKHNEVIVPSNTFVATILSVLEAGLVPKLVEPDPNTFNIDPENIEKAISSKTKVIIAVDLYGKLCDYDELEKIAVKNNLIIVSDSAQSHGAEYKKMKSGSISLATAFSFYPGKNIGALGDAGCITTNDKKIHETCLSLRNYGSILKYENQLIGRNNRMDEIQAAILIKKIKYYQKELDKRRSIAKKYLKYIRNENIILPENNVEKEHSWHLFVIKTENREKLRNFLHRNGIETLIHYPIPIHKQKCFNGLFRNNNFELTDRLSKSILSIPLYNTLTENEVEKIITLLNKFKI